MKCRNCGQDNPPEASFCDNCGTELAAEAEKPLPEEVPGPSQIPRRWRLIGGIAMLIVIGVVIGLTLLSDGAETTQQTKTTTTAIPSSQGIQVGNLAPDFQLQDLDGETISLSDLRGNPVMVNFWATWCGPCCSEMPYLQQIYDEWQDTDLVLLTINKRESLSEVSSFMQDNGYSFPVLLDTNNDVSQDYNIAGIPTTFFIDRDGIIQEQRIGSFPSKEAIEDCLSKIMSPTTTSTTTPASTTPSLPLTTVADTTSITFPDSNLEAAIREAIKKPNGPIYISDLESLNILEASEADIYDLTGLEHCVNLQKINFWINNIHDLSSLANLINLREVNLGENDISDISPLAELAKLELLYIWDNNINDLSPLENLTNLEQLNFVYNQVSDLSPLSGLTNLHDLGAGQNNISDITPLANLSNLQYLNLLKNNISDLSPLANLTKLEVLTLHDNMISEVAPLANLIKLRWLELQRNNIIDILPLVNNQGLSSGDKLDLTSNPLSATSIDVYIPQLEARGVDVTY